MRMNVSPHKAMQSWPGVFCQEPSVEGNLGDISCEVGGGLNAWDRHQNKHQTLVCSINLMLHACCKSGELSKVQNIEGENGSEGVTPPN
jgi:hypothetical protein